MTRLKRAVLLASLIATSTHAQTNRAGPALPKWLTAQMARYEVTPPQAAPSSIWRITRHGAAAYYLVAPCCDQFDPLLDAQGKQLCSPTGGIHGLGDGRCPLPADPHTAIQLIWVHPKSVLQNPPMPRLGQP